MARFLKEKWRKNFKKSDSRGPKILAVLADMIRKLLKNFKNFGRFSGYDSKVAQKGYLKSKNFGRFSGYDSKVAQNAPSGRKILDYLADTIQKLV